MPLRHAPGAERNRELLLQVLARLLPRPARVLELGSGTGEHAVYLAGRLPWLLWQPSDPDPAARASIAAWTARTGARNVLPPLDLDLLAPAWRLQRADALACLAVLHVAPPAAGEALLEGAADVLPAGGPLLVSGVFGRAGAPPALARRLSDLEALRRRRGEPGLPDAEALAARARGHDLALEDRRELPDDALLLVLRRGPA